MSGGLIDRPSSPVRVGPCTRVRGQVRRARQSEYPIKVIRAFVISCKVDLAMTLT